MIRLIGVNDTIMIEISQKQHQILALLLKSDSLSSSQVHHELLKTVGDLSLVTVKRELSALTFAGLITAFSKGRSRTYGISALGRIFSQIDASAYCAVEPDKRYGL